MKEELDALRETLRRREADAAQLAQRADAAEARALAAENARHAADASALAIEVKELRASQSSMAHEVAREVTARVVEEVGGDLHEIFRRSIAPAGEGIRKRRETVRASTPRTTRCCSGSRTGTARRLSACRGSTTSGASSCGS